ncbi:phenylalanyl-tRNA synthetase beta subunit [Jezberella montanilacus]|uniref:Phenylalanine--tRNA ligase beta subunit n=1 Tax=Jezberella montanilacus TaxID=323426 RepID=A0A2T0XIY8_9BURK|nr:phenylalanine--tRNA ligase subunit beta [Jezberella montanilacus]PRY98919.1 phenylalanyl-tRNA synthetase beta subunit [Jezberella montanilacus]|eukprot:gene4526-4572_t
MQFPESWLRTLVDPEISTQALSHKLTMAGLEVEEENPVAPMFSGIIVGRIESTEQHPNADKLKVCAVDDGSGQLLQIVCGAPNAAAGLKVPLATVGAHMPDGMKIGVAKMRGVESSGMLCSARELGLSQDHAGLLVLPDDAPVGQDIRQALRLNDVLFTLKLTPNRADCLSILGVAREVAALTGAKLTPPSAEPVAVTLSDIVPTRIEATDLCGRFVGRVIRGVNAYSKTPAWMVERLERAGQRSVSALVDISNYVMLECGRPTHVFDLDKMHGDSLTVRWARSGESLKLLNGKTIDLDPSMGVIVSGGHVESLAGIMGGDSTAVSLDTKNIYLEAAFWWPDAIAGRARKLKLTSEASHRFERGVDFSTNREDLELISRLIMDVCGGEAGPLDDQIVNVPKRQPVTMRLTRCRRVLGVDVSAETADAVFKSLGFAFTQHDDSFVVTPPSYRFDIRIEEDLIEEIARIIGFENIPAVPPLARAKMRIAPEISRGTHQLRHEVAALDYQEVINFSFVDETWETDMIGQSDPIKLLNPIASQLAVMRSSLIPGLIANIKYNVNRKQSRVRVFELGRVFMRDAAATDGPLSVALVSQPQRLAGAAWGGVLDTQWGVSDRQVDFFDVKSDIESLFGQLANRLKFVPDSHAALHPGRSARIEFDGQFAGWLGELHPQWVQEQELSTAPVVFELTLDSLSILAMPHPQELSRQPVVQRDLAVWVDNNTAVGSLLDMIKSMTLEYSELSIVKQVNLFDVWKDKAVENSTEKSLAFRFFLQDAEATLDDGRVDACMLKIRDALASHYGARQR